MPRCAKTFAPPSIGAWARWVRTCWVFASRSVRCRCGRNCRLHEHGLYVGKALARLAQSTAPSKRLQMELQLALGSFSYHAQGSTPQTIQAFAGALRLAQASNDLTGQLRAV